MSKGSPQPCTEISITQDKTTKRTFNHNFMLQKQSPFINLKNYMLYVLVVHTHIACHGMCIEVNGQLSGVSSLHHAGAGN